MGSPHPFYLKQWAAWVPGRESEAAWRAWATGDAAVADALPPTQPVPLLLRRRVSPIGQQALRAAWRLPDAATSRIVFCSRDGEIGRTLSILDSLDRIGEVSPADFTLSVHHALAGLLSIAHHNRHGHTTVAAGTDSFGAGMQEALGCLGERPDEPVVLVHFLEPLPPPYSDFDDHQGGPLALALTLAAGDGEDPISLTTAPSLAPAEPEPLALVFLRFWLSGAQQASAVGERATWQWQRAPIRD